MPRFFYIQTMKMLSSNLYLVYLYITVVIAGVVIARGWNVVILPYLMQYFQFPLLILLYLHLHFGNYKLFT